MVFPEIFSLRITSISEDDKSGKSSDQLRIVNFSERSLGWASVNDTFNLFCYILIMYIH